MVGCLVNEDIGRLDVAVQDAVSVQVVERADQVVVHSAKLRVVERKPDVLVQGSMGARHDDDRHLVTRDDVVNVLHALVFDVAQDGNLAHAVAWHAVLRRRALGLFQCDVAVREHALLVDAPMPARALERRVLRDALALHGVRDEKI